MTADEAGCTGDENRSCHRRLRAAAVLRFVIRLEGRIALLDRPPPPLVLAIPRDRFCQTLVKRHLGLPAQGAELAGVERVAAIMSLPVLDGRDERCWFAHELQDAMRQIE